MVLSLTQCAVSVPASTPLAGLMSYAAQIALLRHTALIMRPSPPASVFVVPDWGTADAKVERLSMAPRLMNWLEKAGLLKGLSTRMTLSSLFDPLTQPELTKNVPVLPGVVPNI